MVLAFVVTLAGYYRVQVLDQKHYEALGEKYRIKTMPIKATRGYIYDRDGHLLAQSMPTYNLVLLRDEMEQRWSHLRARLSGLLSMPEEQLSQLFKQGSALLSKPIVLKQNISYSETLRYKRLARRYPGLAIEIAEKRTYNHPGIFSHALGYISVADTKAMANRPELRLGQVIGKSGVELAYDHLLTGIDGERTIQIDSRGVYRSQEITTPPVPGSDLYLSLDFELQALAMQAMAGRGGAIVMMDIHSGDLLVYMSSPTYDLNLFSGHMSNKRWDIMADAANEPFLNRPVQGIYAPGSIFKIVTALASLKLGNVSIGTEFFCNGAFRLRNHPYRCHKKGGHGTVDMLEAIQYSCNVYFYNLGKELNIDDLAEVAKDLGFGVKTGIDLVGERSGLMPSKAWKRENRQAMWYPGETLSVAIGQGALNVTPLQLTVLMAAIASEGTVPKPHFLLQSKQGKSVQSFERGTRKVKDIPAEYYRMMKEAMWRVVNKDRGTGSKARVPGMNVCGKTGTAQLIDFEKENDDDYEDKYLNAWFAGFAPRDEPQVALIVLVEQSGHGGYRAAPIAKLLFETWRDRHGANPT